jgi:hypothetical protein
MDLLILASILHFGICRDCTADLLAVDQDMHAYAAFVKSVANTDTSGR